MEKSTTLVPGDLVTALIALALVVSLVALRGMSRGRLEVKLSDAAIAVIPIMVWLLISGRIAKIAVGSEGVSVETAREAIVSASGKVIKSQVAELPVAPVEVAAKGGVAEIPALIRSRVEGLRFTVDGHGHYVESAIKTYLTELTQQLFFRFVILERADHKFAGMFDARPLAKALAEANQWRSFAEQLDAGNLAALSRNPGFVAADRAIGKEATKKQALAQMEKFDADWLPVVNSDGRFAGIVERSRLTASLILDVTDQLESGPSPAGGV